MTVQLYNAAGEVMETKSSSAPDFDPTFFWSGALSGDDVTRVIQKPYQWHSWTYICASKIAQTIGSLTSILQKGDDSNDVITQHPILDLLDKPNPFMDGSEFIESVILNLLLPSTGGTGGQCFIIPADEMGNPVDIMGGQMPYEMYPFSEDFVEAKKENHKFVGWVFKHPSGREIPYFNDEIIRIKLVNPYNILGGMSPFSALQLSIANDAKGLKISDKFYDNNAMLGTVLKTDQKLQPTQFEQIKGQFNAQHAGWKNAGKTALLHSGLEMQEQSHNLKDLQYTEQQGITREKVQAAYGVSNTILGLGERTNRATAEVEQEQFWDGTIIPYINKYWDGLNQQWIKWQDRREYMGYFDLSGIAALKKNQTAKITNAGKLIDQGVTPNGAYKTVGLEIDTDEMPWLDFPLVKGARINLESGEMVGGFGGQMVTEPANEPQKSVKSIIQVVKDEKDLVWYKYLEKVLNAPEKDYKKTFIKFINGQRNRFNDQVDEWVKQNTKAFKAAAGAKVSDFMIPKKFEDSTLIDVSDPVYDDVIARQTAEMTGTLGSLSNFNPAGNDGKAIRKARYKMLRKINTTTFTTMGKEIETVLKENPDDTINQLAKKIKEAERRVANARIASSAQIVARTETSSVASNSRFDIMKSEGIETHIWITAGDELVRDSHVEEGLNPEGPTKMGEPFPVTGLKYPLDNDGAPEETINCRCTTVIGEE